MHSTVDYCWPNSFSPLHIEPKLKQQMRSTKNQTTPRHVNVNMDDIFKIPEKNRRAFFLIISPLIVLALILIIAVAVVPPVVISMLASRNSNSESISITTTTTISTTTVTCTSGLSQTPSGTCVNTQIDFNNCGSVGYVCSSNYTSCSGGLCSTTPAVQLSGALAVPGFSNPVSIIDDAITMVTLPLNLILYNYATNNITVSSNGVVCLGVCSTAYANGNLPDSHFGGPTAFCYWDDLAISPGTSQTIYYGVSGTAPNRVTTFEFYESAYSSSSQYYHFQVIFYENLPNKVSCFYFETFGGGVSATIGIQGSSSGPSMTYSVDQLNAVTYNTTITFDTSAGTFTG